MYIVKPMQAKTYIRDHTKYVYSINLAATFVTGSSYPSIGILFIFKLEFWLQYCTLLLNLRTLHNYATMGKIYNIR